jgi:hypothetical protein
MRLRFPFADGSEPCWEAIPVFAVNNTSSARRYLVLSVAI